MRAMYSFGEDNPDRLAWHQLKNHFDQWKGNVWIPSITHDDIKRIKKELSPKRAGGNIGLGTTTPSARLYIGNYTGSPHMVINADGNIAIQCEKAVK